MGYCSNPQRHWTSAGKLHRPDTPSGRRPFFGQDVLRSNQNLIHNMPVDIREPEIAALEAVGEAGVVDT
jgi:hypothetical protein